MFVNLASDIAQIILEISGFWARSPKMTIRNAASCGSASFARRGKANPVVDCHLWAFRPFLHASWGRGLPRANAKLSLSQTTPCKPEDKTVKNRDESCGLRG
jgi:hypothetical protein